MGVRGPWLWVCLVFLLCAVLASAEKDFYKLLGVERDSTAKEIKRAFRKLSLKYHPDKTKDPDDAQTFVEVNEAYEVLGNEEKRQLYDIGGEKALEQQNKPASPFDAFFGGGGRNGARKGPNYSMELSVTLEDIYNGADKSFSINRKVLCKKCRGTGAKDGATKKCKTCKGKGQVTTLQQLGPGFNVQMQAACTKCGGKGNIAKTKCPNCKGARLEMEEKLLDAIIERGMPDKYDIVFERASEQSPDTVPGDVVLTVTTKKHAKFTRKNDDLHYTMKISLKDALLGFSKEIKQLDGRKVTVARDEVTPPFYVEKIKGEGMPHHNYASDTGDLYVKFDVRFPKALTADQKAEIEKLL